MSLVLLSHALECEHFILHFILKSSFSGHAGTVPPGPAPSGGVRFLPQMPAEIGHAQRECEQRSRASSQATNQASGSFGGLLCRCFRLVEEESGRGVALFLVFAV